MTQGSAWQEKGVILIADVQEDVVYLNITSPQLWHFMAEGIRIFHKSLSGSPFMPFVQHCPWHLPYQALPHQNNRKVETETMSGLPKIWDWKIRGSVSQVSVYKLRTVFYMGNHFGECPVIFYLTRPPEFTHILLGIWYLKCSDLQGLPSMNSWSTLTFSGLGVSRC